MNPNLKNRPKATGEAGAIRCSWDVHEWFVKFERKLRLFVSIHENEGHEISPKLFRTEILGEDP